MKPTHPEAARIWQRVLIPEPREQQTLQLLMRQLSLDHAYLKQLTKANDDRTVELLVQEYAEQFRCLKGILILSADSLPRNVSTGGAGNSLRGCFDHALQRLSAYQLRSSDPVYGPVFRDLAGQTEHHIRYIAQLLGSSLKEGNEKGR